ncbi:MAG: hypothetical protein HRU13_03385 [Phycisphaerales bacterium]|nr:hypothetical protein [Phycisphaerales bacterium]
MIDALFDLLATTAAAVPPAAPAADPSTAPPMDTKPVVQVVFIVMGLTIATIVLVAGLLAMAMLRHASRGASPTRTEHVDAWAEAGKRAQAEPSAGDILDGLDD